jgi:hypothetical protein
MIKLISRLAFRLILVSMLVGAPGAFNPSTFADEGMVLEAGSYSCPTVTGCGNWGCHSNGQGGKDCVLYNLQGSTHCTGSRECDLNP